jgi:hypothetical protein
MLAAGPTGGILQQPLSTGVALAEPMTGRGAC